ncbi:RAMP superfamily CRISPR-associated protein [Nocardiopsis ansamitocini]|uniref:CRISPR type III-associated protein domain-containing protein n=1 Tax=Nocardiopsis ansamitocini TaxID=1670832 RepID=A0A9W6UKU8_9ACTN|nr:RAMP superfamily CRISPR-associated protein [Nocardiopsis ansamitocini]GLU49430.1 hypothetical protein Nans01_37810 [Nocardiopsis ansamitocini]
MSTTKNSEDTTQGVPGLAAGAIRETALVWEVAVRLRLLGDTHVGAALDTPRHAAESDVAGLVDRDPVSGVPRLRATTLAGLLRHHLTARLGGLDAPTGPDDPVPRGADVLFGKPSVPREPNELGPGATDSPLELDDCVALLPEGVGISVRTGNRIDRNRGAAASGGLWQFEVLPAGTLFTATLRLRVRNRADEGRLLALLALAADGLRGPVAGPDIRLGARTGRGYGAVRAEVWHARRHDLATVEGWAGYYAWTWAERRQRAERGLDAGPRDERLRDLLDSRASECADAYRAALDAVGADQRDRDELVLAVAVAEQPAEVLAAGAGGPVRPGLVMIGDVPGPGAPDRTDRAHRTRPRFTGDGAVEWQPMLGDTGLFAMVKRIGRRLATDAADAAGYAGGEARPAGPEARTGAVRARAWHASWWGEDPAPGSGRPPAPSQVRLRDAPAIDGGHPMAVTRNSIDALFGDTVDGRLFTDALHAGGTARVVLDVFGADDSVRGLLALVVRELGTVAFDGVGAGWGVGQGRLTVTGATLTRHRPGAAPEPTDLIAAVHGTDPVARSRAQEWVGALHDRLAPTAAADAPRGEDR